MRLITPEAKELGAFENEVVPVDAQGKTGKEATEGEIFEVRLQILTAGARIVLQPITQGSSEIGGRSHQTRLSR